jgi:Tfp pilus assembly protein PilV
MIDTFSTRLPDRASQRGDTLIEVVISALVLAAIVVGTLTGLNSANRVTSLDRERSQADTLAQQEEEQLRSLPINKLSELSETHKVIQHEVNAGGTEYKIASTAQYISDATATSSCSSTSPQADYIETSSKVTWNALGEGKPVVETSIISPPPSADAIAQVTNESGEPVPKMTVTSTGPTNMTTETSTDGCAILALLPGEYALNVHRTGYVDENSYANSDEDPLTDSPFYIVAENTVKKAYEFAEAATLEASFENSATKVEANGDTLVAYNVNANPANKTFGTVGKLEPKIDASLFPASSKYVFFAGSCQEDEPHAVGASDLEGVELHPGEHRGLTLPLPPVKIKVWSGAPGTASVKGHEVANAAVKLTDEGCHVTHEATTSSAGTLTYPAPFGKYKLCVWGGSSGYAADRKYTTGIFSNNTLTGPSEAATMTNGKEVETGYSVVYLGSSAPTSPGTLESSTTGC